jgi:hypothetical protein
MGRPVANLNRVGDYCRLMLNLLEIFDAPTLVVTVTVAMPATGLAQIFLLPAQNPLFFPVSPRVPKARSSEMIGNDDDRACREGIRAKVKVARVQNEVQSLLRHDRDDEVIGVIACVVLIEPEDSPAIRTGGGIASQLASDCV